MPRRERFASVLCDSAPLRSSDGSNSAGTPHARIIRRPIIGTYMKRSAIRCSPAWSSPLTGRSAMTNHSHPTSREGARCRRATATMVTAHEADGHRHHQRHGIITERVEGRKVRRPDGLPDVLAVADDGVGQASGPGESGETGHRANAPLDHHRRHARRRRENQQRDLLDEQPSPHHFFAASSHPAERPDVEQQQKHWQRDDHRLRHERQHEQHRHHHVPPAGGLPHVRTNRRRS